MKQSVCTMERLFFFVFSRLNWTIRLQITNPSDIQRPEKLFGYLDPLKRNIIYTYQMENVGTLG